MTATMSETSPPATEAVPGAATPAAPRRRGEVRWSDTTGAAPITETSWVTVRVTPQLHAQLWAIAEHEDRRIGMQAARLLAAATESYFVTHPEVRAKVEYPPATVRRARAQRKAAAQQAQAQAQQAAV